MPGFNFYYFHHFDLVCVPGERVEFYVIKISENQGLPLPAPRKHQVKMVKGKIIKLESGNKPQSTNSLLKTLAISKILVCFESTCIYCLKQCFLKGGVCYPRGRFENSRGCFWLYLVWGFLYYSMK